MNVTSQQQVTQNQLNFVVSFLTKHPEFVLGHFRQCYAAEQALKEARTAKTEATKDKEFLHAELRKAAEFNKDLQLRLEEAGKEIERLSNASPSLAAIVSFVEKSALTPQEPPASAGASTSSSQSRKRTNDESRDDQAVNKTRGAKSSRRTK